MKSLTESDVNRKNKLSVYACMWPQVWHEQERCGALLLLHALHGQQAAEDREWWGASGSERCWMGGEWAGKNRVERWKSDRQWGRARKGEGRLLPSPAFLACSKQEEEDPTTQAEEECLQGAVHPEEFVAIADYSATDETQVALWVYSLWVQLVRWQD